MVMRKKISKDNQGIALISVMICVMLSFLLSATILRVSLLSYLQKGVAKQATETFYENESYMDDIKMGIQQKMAIAMTSSTTKDQASFVKNFKAALVGDESWATNKDKVAAALKAFIQTTEATDVSVKVTGDCFVEAAKGEYVIRGVEIEYTDSSKGGYYSKIKTDIRIRAPYYSTTSSTSLGDYSMVAGGGAVFSGLSANSVLTQEGDVYIGYQTYNASTNVASDMTISDQCSLVLSGSTVTINGDVKVSDHSNLAIIAKTVVIRGKIYIDSTSTLIVSSRTTKFTCQDIVIDGKSISGGAYTSNSPSQTISKLPKANDANQYNGSGKGGRIYYYEVPAAAVDGSADFAEKAKNGTSYEVGYSKTYGTNDNGTQKTDNANKAFTQKSGSLYVLSALDSVMEFKATELPHPNVSVSGVSGKYDEKLVELINVYELVTKCNGSGAISRKNPASALTSSGYSEDGSHYYTATGNSTNANYLGGEWIKYKYHTSTSATTEVQVMLNIGTGVQELNGNAYHFVVANEDIRFNDQNNAIQSTGIYITTGKLTYMSRKGESTCKSLKNLGMTTNTAVNAKVQEDWAAFCDKVGLQTFIDSNNKAPSYAITNNYFKGGIRVLYQGTSGGGGTTQIDKVKNMSLEVVSFENWEKQ